MSDRPNKDEPGKGGPFKGSTLKSRGRGLNRRQRRGGQQPRGRQARPSGNWQWDGQSVVPFAGIPSRAPQAGHGHRGCRGRGFNWRWKILQERDSERQQNQRSRCAHLGQQLGGTSKSSPLLATPAPGAPRPSGSFPPGQGPQSSSELEAVEKLKRQGRIYLAARVAFLNQVRLFNRRFGRSATLADWVDEPAAEASAEVQFYKKRKLLNRRRAERRKLKRQAERDAKVERAVAAATQVEAAGADESIPCAIEPTGGNSAAPPQGEVAVNVAENVETRPPVPNQFVLGVGQCIVLNSGHWPVLYSPKVKMSAPAPTPDTVPADLSTPVEKVTHAPAIQAASSSSPGLDEPLPELSTHEDFGTNDINNNGMSSVPDLTASSELETSSQDLIDLWALNDDEWETPSLALEADEMGDFLILSPSDFEVSTTANPDIGGSA